MSIGSWVNGPIAKKHFPLFKDKKPLSDLWRWRWANLQSDQYEYRLIVQLRQDKPNLKAWLAVKIGDDWAMAARLESHGHNGLHCHLECAENGLTVGMIEPPDARSIPYWKDHNRRPNRVFSEKDAWELAVGFFRAKESNVGTLGI